MDDGQWHHVVGIHEAPAIELYVDGVRVDVTNVGTHIHDTTALLFFGRSSSGAEPYSGAIDEVAVYRRALTESEVVAHFAASGR